MASLYTAYFDESGTHPDSEYVVVAGFISNATEWEAFSQRWHQVLADSQIDYFHMTDFESRKGPFDGWTEEERRDLLNRLLPIIHDHTFWSIGCVVLRKWFDSHLSDAAKQICGNAYGTAALACFRNNGLVLQKADAWMDCSMESGAQGRGALQLLVEEDSKFPKWLQEHRILSLSFLDKSAPPLQSADILAYELYKQSQRQFGQDDRPPRYPLKQLANKKGRWHYVQEAHLIELNEDITRQLHNLGYDA